jgi:hypothetical protein
MRVLEKDQKPDPDRVLALFGREWNRLVTDSAALEAPPDDVRAVKSLLRELRNFARVLALLPKAEGEQALAAVAGMVMQGQRAEKALAQFGLKPCAGLTGVRAAGKLLAAYDSRCQRAIVFPAKSSEMTIVRRVRLRSTMCVPPCDAGVKPRPPMPASRPECMSTRVITAKASRTCTKARTPTTWPG